MASLCWLIVRQKWRVPLVKTGLIRLARFLGEPWDILYQTRENIIHPRSICKSCSSQVPHWSWRFQLFGTNKFHGSYRSTLHRLLPCFHTVCESCLYREKGSQCCPMCKERFNLGDEGITGLKARETNCKNIISSILKKFRFLQIWHCCNALIQTILSGELLCE